ncbi:NADH-ubiquinone oxidoreductase B12 subunit family-domain-containing protein [Microdochium trichocladiopsis]|uniref:NADH-ubiquinone oxidoreductase B12 subunit family-domain-containing protein n=1 Tax=Microdochium trichocladiopsis TaxID=1682393 RepID=A0A9P8YEX9_9PEZI|nr:NADH-ubiquinone oxidoreductase B12 subunit family-domain-containing protein [Microdochium trichocladiopsis]KAH7037746.1 NADH-ubiquinone oxidoreductase B12 subunit family-domain-containing protein [Microdochium trichocladiopsis]
MYPSRILRADKGTKPNITGFDVSKFAASAGQPRYDPWERAEAWRYTGQFSRWQRFNRAFPGLGIATVAFAGYLAYEQLTAKDDHHGHGEEHH